MRRLERFWANQNSGRRLCDVFTFASSELNSTQLVVAMRDIDNVDKLLGTFSAAAATTTTFVQPDRQSGLSAIAKTFSRLLR